MAKKLVTTLADQNYFTAASASLAGDKDQAFRYLNQAIDRHERNLVTLKVDPQFEPLRGDPRFAVALKRINLS